MTFDEFQKQWMTKGIEVFVQKVTSVHSEKMVGHEYWFRKICKDGFHTTIFFNGSFGWTEEYAQCEAMLCTENPYYMEQIRKYMND